MTHDEMIDTLKSLRESQREFIDPKEPNDIFVDDVTALSMAIDLLADCPSPPTTRTEILNAAKRCVCGGRDVDYGQPEDNLETIGVLWSTYLRVSHDFNHGLSYNGITPKDVANMMILLKVARNATGKGKMDNWTDIAGYAAIGGEV